MNNQGTTNNNNNNEITEEGMDLGTSSSNDEGMNLGTNSSYDEATLMDSSSATNNNHQITEKDHVAVFVAFNGKWEFDGKEWFFKNFKFSMIVVPKHITLSEFIDILHQQFEDTKKFYHLKLEVHYRTGCPWFPVTEIKNDQDLSVFISETSKTKLPLCVTPRFLLDDEISFGDDEERRKGDVRVLVAYNGKWIWDGEKWLFENSKGSIMDVFKNVTLSEITDMLYKKFKVDPEFYGLKLEVHYRGGSPWFPIIEIERDEDLSVFISESLKTKLPLCVTRVAKVVEVKGAEHGGKDDRPEKRLINAISERDWVKAREIINTEEVTWTSTLNDQYGYTALHYAVGRYRDNEVVKEILKEIKKEELLTIVDNDMLNPVQYAAMFGNTEALKIMLKDNLKCLFVPEDYGDLPIHLALNATEMKTVLYLFEQMKRHKVEYDKLLKGMHGRNLWLKVIDAGLIEVAYELIDDYPSFANTAHNDKSTLEYIISKTELFYSGTSYSFYSRFLYHVVPIEKNSFGSTDTSDVENQVTPKKDKFVTKYTRILHNVISRICVLWERALLHGKHKLPPN